jgi:hypothetical protein
VQSQAHATLPELCLIYVDDAGQTRYVIDKDTVLQGKPEHGQRLAAYVNDEAYVARSPGVGAASAGTLNFSPRLRPARP